MGGISRARPKSYPLKASILERAEVVADFRVGPVGVADDFAADDAFSIDDVGFGPAFGVEELGGGLVGIADADEVNMMAGEEAVVGGRVLVDADGKDGKLGVVMLKLKERGHLLDTGRAPGGPEVQQHDTAAIAGEVNGGFAIGDGEIRSGFAGLAGMSSAIASREKKERGQHSQTEETEKPHVLIIRSYRV
jgi:hypothetical protein